MCNASGILSEKTELWIHSVWKIQQVYVHAGHTSEQVTHCGSSPATACLQGQQLICQHTARQHFDSEVISNIKIASLGLNSVTRIPQPLEEKPNCSMGYALAKASIAPPSAGAGTEAVTHPGLHCHHSQVTAENEFNKG